MKKILYIIAMLIAISSCGNNNEAVNNIEVSSPENKVADIKENIVDGEEIIEFIELEGQPDY